jgi:hypothetical protein
MRADWGSVNRQLGYKTDLVELTGLEPMAKVEEASRDICYDDHGTYV